MESAVAVLPRRQQEGVTRCGHQGGVGDEANDICQGRAVVEGLTSNGRHATRDGDGAEQCTSVKGGVTDGVDRRRDHGIAASGNQRACSRLDDRVTAIAGVIIGIAAGYGDA